MRITKFGHCCLLIEEKNLRILTDPGSFTSEQNTLKNIDVVLITHEHQDHVHIDSVKNLLKNNPRVQIITNKSVGKLLGIEKIKYEIIEDKQFTKINNVLIEGFGTTHAIIHSSIPIVENTGYFINNKLFYPGDALTNPHKYVEILAWPVAGPWIKISEALDYAIELKPKIVFPVHDAVLASGMREFSKRMADIILKPKGIEFIQIDDGKSVEL